MMPVGLTEVAALTVVVVPQLEDALPSYWWMLVEEARKPLPLVLVAPRHRLLPLLLERRIVVVDIADSAP